MAKKKFKDTKFGKILLKIKPLIKSVPLVGPIVGPVLDEVKGEGKGEILSESGSLKGADWPQIISGIVTIILMFLALTGKISWDDAETAKSFID